MKKLAVFLGFIVVTVTAGVTLAQKVEVEQVPMTWRQASISDGEQLYAELCAVCHGKGAMGDGPAASALKKPVPNLTKLAARYDGEFPRQMVEEAITGSERVASHGSVEMPMWGQAFDEVRPDWKPARRKAFARQRIYNLTEYLSTIQAE